MEQKACPQQGIVGFLDILGYQTLLKNNEPEDIAATVLSTLTGLRKTVTETMKSFFEREETKEDIEKVIGSQKWLIFSDTILLTSPYKEEDGDTKKVAIWVISLFTIIILYRHLFDEGLPTRGDISFGKFLVEDYCFAGRTIIRSYQETNKLDLSVITLDESGQKEIQKFATHKNYPQIMHLIDPYLLPLKDGKTKEGQILVPTIFLKPIPANKDIRELVARSFLMHKKDTEPLTLNKLTNTELYYQAMKLRHPDLFKG